MKNHCLEYQESSGIPSGPLDYRGQDRDKLIRFIYQIDHFRFGHNLGGNQQSKPVISFTSLLACNGILRDEISPTLAPLPLFDICADGCSGPKKLVGQGAADPRNRIQRPSKRHNSPGELEGPRRQIPARLFHFTLQPLILPLHGPFRVVFVGFMSGLCLAPVMSGLSGLCRVYCSSGTGCSCQSFRSSQRARTTRGHASHAKRFGSDCPSVPDIRCL